MSLRSVRQKPSETTANGEIITLTCIIRHLETRKCEDLIERIPTHIQRKWIWLDFICCHIKYLKYHFVECGLSRMQYGLTITWTLLGNRVNSGMSLSPYGCSVFPYRISMNDPWMRTLLWRYSRFFCRIVHGKDFGDPCDISCWWLWVVIRGHDAINRVPLAGCSKVTNILLIQPRIFNRNNENITGLNVCKIGPVKMIRCN